MEQIKSNIKRSLSWFPYLMFFAGSFIYFGFFANYIFFYQEKSSLFIFSGNFLKENLHQPGGFLIWLGKLITTFYYYPLAGALLQSTILTLIPISVSKTTLLLNSKESLIISLITGVTFFYLQTDYRFFLFNDLGVLLEISLFLFIIKYKSLLKGWLAVIIAPLCYYLTGGFTWIFLLLMTGYFALYEKKGGWIKIIVLLVISFLMFYISKEYLFFQTEKTLLTFPFSDTKTGSQQAVLFSVSAIISLLPVAARIDKKIILKNTNSDPIRYGIVSIITCILLIIIGIERFDNKTKEYFHVEKLFYENKFDEVVEFNTRNPTTNLLTLFLNNVALCETDKLDDLLFHFPQNKDGKTLFLKWEIAGEILNRGGYFYYAIGMINEAHRWAFENMVMRGHTPEGLKMLIKTELINGNAEVAASYISILRKTLFYRKEAQFFEKQLITAAYDREIIEKKEIKVMHDFFSITDNPYVNLEIILESDSLNRKAFEYKMAYLLLQKNFSGIEHNLRKFEKLGFNSLPVHIEEAVIALSVSNKGKLPDIGNFQISKNTEIRWNQFLNVLKQYGNDVKSAEPALKRRFGDTYWYYVFYR
jgi:hypothetical protein